MDYSQYQPGGSIYQTLVLQYGQDSADAISAAAATGDEDAVLNAIADARGNQQKDTSTLDAFGNELIDPANPYSLQNFAGTYVGDITSGIASNAEGAIENTIIGFLKNPLFLGAIAIGGVIYFGGGDWLKNQIKSAFK